ncbi:MAG: hypothetical protein V7688_09565 [Alcanivorax jadensis]|uniref:hypothetical protein n=1 Tax=Alcanivorax jadensis TaxID=64988 RepID=UPI0030025BB3
MALEEKRALDEILVRVNSKTSASGGDGLALRFRRWVESDGIEIPGTSQIEDPVPSDWASPDVVDRLGELPASLQQQVDALSAKVAELEAKLAQQ